MAGNDNRQSAARIDGWTRILIRILVCLLVSMTVAQYALQFPAVRNWLTGVDRLEGIPYSDALFFCKFARIVV
ncbi:hypothetical protein IDH44_08295 [Paenibacillus sp. IB182496]|uniref:Uncharacterized protein n=1 Tax=Paenibacillus sabuli TaxID=2772509 RepID=A0A927GR36_9BACL|nr:hypothetical protein [Paenibacillus sabuli]MBD2845189.1 hypothetical protein [Paenibacillus sabuli]